MEILHLNNNHNNKLLHIGEMGLKTEYSELTSRARNTHYDFPKGWSMFNHIEMKQSPMVLDPHTYPLSLESCSQRTSLIREVRNVETKENSQKRLNNNNVVIKRSEGPLVLSQGS